MTEVEKVRLLIGDLTVTYVFTDAQITYFLTENSNNIRLASADVLDAWAAKYATNVDSETIAGYSYSQKIFDTLTKKASGLRSQESDVPILAWAEMDLTEGSGITAEED